MSLKSEILNMLVNSGGEYISGEAIGNQLYCSRNAVWKAINSLKKDGYDIKAVTNKGYALFGGDVLSAHGILKYLSAPLDITVLDSATSTNDLLKIKAEQGASEGTVLIANKQTKGKGRLGRAFFSPDSGIYISILLRPQFSAQDALMITTSAAVAVCDAVSNICGKECGIKWVNDIFLDGLKICGILTEASLDFESGGLQYAVLGTGINLAHPLGGFPPELSGVAGAIYDELPKDMDIKNRFCAEYLNAFFAYYNDLQKRRFMAEYKRRSIVLGRRISVIKNGGATPALAVDIDDDARLLVQYDDGGREILQSGEISIKLQ